jgi:hypothetical protein
VYTIKELKKSCRAMPIIIILDHHSRKLDGDCTPIPREERSGGVVSHQSI